MKKNIKYTITILTLFIQSFIVSASSFNINEALKLQYSAPKSAINLLLSDHKNLTSMTNDEFLSHQLLLFRLAKKIENNELTRTTFENISERLAIIDTYKPWIKLLQIWQLLSDKKYSQADDTLQTISSDMIDSKPASFQMLFYYVIGVLNIRQDAYEEALNKLIKANQLAIDLGDKNIEMQVYSQLAVIDYYQQRYDKALKKSLYLEKMARSLNDDFMEVISLSRIVTIYHVMVINQNVLIDTKNNEKEKNSLIQARDEYRRKANSILEKALVKSRTIGSIETELRLLISSQNHYLEDRLYEDAIVVGEKVTKLATEHNQLFEKGVAYNNISIAYRKLEKYQRAIIALQSAEAIYREIDNEQSLLWVLEDYSLTYEASGQYELALSYYKKLHRSTLDLQKKTNNKKVIELQELFEHEKNVNALQKLNQRNIEQLENDEFQKGIFISFGLIFILITFLILKDRRTISQKNDLLDGFNIKLKEQTLKDPLTGLFNRRLLNDIKEKLLMTSDLVNQEEYLKQNIGLVILDIDLFKNVNDSFGHDVGDLVIQHISTELLEATTDNDYVIRWGGEEFLIILMDTTKEGVHSFCKKILTQRNSTPINVLSHTLNVTFSLGYISSPFVEKRPNWFTWDDSFKLIDNCLYLAKKQGRNKAISINVDNKSATDKQKEILLKDLSNDNYVIPSTVQLEVIQGEKLK